MKLPKFVPHDIANLPVYKDGKGYDRVRLPDHPYAQAGLGYIFVHRLVVENELGRFLDPKEVVHHKNEIPDDNRSENLALFPSTAEHVAHHKRLPSPPADELQCLVHKMVLSKVAEHYGVAVVTIQRWAREHRVRVPSGGARRVKTPAPREQLLSLLGQYSVPDTAEQLGVGDGLVRKWMRQYGINGRTMESKRNASRQPTKEKLTELIRTHSISETAVLLGISYNTTRRWCDRLGVERPCYK